MTTTHQKIWGSEVWIVNTDEYCGKKFSLARWHAFDYVLRTSYCLPETALALRGGAVRLSAVEFSTRHSEADVYRIEPSGCDQF
jgi:hypothetical protein